jgi:hypothetical protein
MCQQLNNGLEVQEETNMIITVNVFWEMTNPDPLNMAVDATTTVLFPGWFLIDER